MEDFAQILKSLFEPQSEIRQILGVTLRMAATSTVISFALGLLFGALIGANEFKLKRAVMGVTSTLMGLPPVLAGLLIFFLLSRSGPLGEYKLLYSVAAMVCAQVLLITPVVTNMTATVLGTRKAEMSETMRGIALPKHRQMLLMLRECRAELFATLLLGFGRAISEVGAAQLVGGNIQYKTRVMTTAIVLETNKGNFGMALAIGVLLLIVALIINTAARALQRGADD